MREDPSGELAALGLSFLGAERFGPADGQPAQPCGEDPVRCDGAAGGGFDGVGFLADIYNVRCQRCLARTEQEPRLGKRGGLHFPPHRPSA